MALPATRSSTTFPLDHFWGKPYSGPVGTPFLHPRADTLQVNSRRRLGNAIFISYRRDDSEGEAGRLFDDLTRAFGNDNVFMDVAGISPGVDFRKAIEDNVAHCGVLLAVIGPSWVSIANAAGQQRLDDPNDFVALEIASALKRQVAVIPVLVHEARMPSPDQLPDSLKDFSYRNSVELTHARWNSDVALLVQALGSYVKPAATTAQEPVHATVPVQLPAPHPRAEMPAHVSAKSKLPMLLGIGVAVVIAIVAAVYFIGGHGSDAASGLIGTWHDTVTRPNDSLTSLTISGSEKTVSMHAFGSCQPPPCDWGTQTAAFDGVNATATFNTTEDGGVARAANVTVHRSGSDLDVTVHNTFTDQNGNRQNEVHRVFVAGQ
jgi:hypothetical protein